jgi:hypothetical protein
MDWNPACNKKKISNIEHGMLSDEAMQREITSSFEIPCSIFDISF